MKVRIVPSYELQLDAVIEWEPAPPLYESRWYVVKAIEKDSDATYTLEYETYCDDDPSGCMHDNLGTMRPSAYLVTLVPATEAEVEAKKQAAGLRVAA